MTAGRGHLEPQKSLLSKFPILRRKNEDDSGCAQEMYYYALHKSSWTDKYHHVHSLLNRRCKYKSSLKQRPVEVSSQSRYMVHSTMRIVRPIRGRPAVRSSGLVKSKGNSALTRKGPKHAVDHHELTHHAETSHPPTEGETQLIAQTAKKVTN